MQALTLFHFRSVSPQTLQRVLTAVDFQGQFQGIMNNGQVWRKGARKRGLTYDYNFQTSFLSQNLMTRTHIPQKNCSWPVLTLLNGISDDAFFINTLQLIVVSRQSSSRQLHSLAHCVCPTFILLADQMAGCESHLTPVWPKKHGEQMLWLTHIQTMGMTLISLHTHLSAWKE